MPTKEKTKADLLTELNEKLENENQELKKRNDELVNEIRQVKSTNVELETLKKDLKETNLLRDGNIQLKQKNDELQEIINYQDKQIEILVNGLNKVNTSINRLFENLNYTLGLARENYEKEFNGIQSKLNELDQHKENMEDNK